MLLLIAVFTRQEYVLIVEERERVISGRSAGVAAEHRRSMCVLRAFVVDLSRFVSLCHASKRCHIIRFKSKYFACMSCGDDEGKSLTCTNRDIMVHAIDREPAPLHFSR